MGFQGDRSLDRVRSQWPGQDEGVGRSRGLSADGGATRRMEESGKTAARQLGRGGEESRRRRGCDRRRFAGHAEEVRGGGFGTPNKAEVLERHSPACSRHPRLFFAGGKKTWE